MISFTLGYLSIFVTAHVGHISFTGSDGDDSKALWGWTSNTVYGGARRGWYSSGSAQHYKYDADLTARQMAVERQLLGLAKNPELPQDACTGGYEVAKPIDAISNPYILPLMWRTKLWDWENNTWNASEAASFCHGEELTWRFWVAADHNGFQRIEVLPQDGQSFSSEAKPNDDGISYEFLSAVHLTQDPDTTYYLKDGSLTDTSICQEGPAEGQPWSKYAPHCYDQVFGERKVRVPTWFEAGQTYRLRWTYYGSMEIFDDGSVGHVQGGTIDGLPDEMKAEKAFFARCITMQMKPASECSDTSTSAPTTSDTTTQATEVPETTTVTTTTTAATTTTTAEATTTVATTTTATTTIASTTTETTTIEASTTGTTTTEATTVATTTISTTENSEECSKTWGQCGGVKWTGATCCTAGNVCFKKNEYYSQCFEDSAADTSDSESVSPPSSEAEVVDGVEDYKKCGGKGYTGPTVCANPESVCAKKNEYYSQCRPFRILKNVFV